MFNNRQKVNRKLAARWEYKYIPSVYQGETDRDQRKADAPTFEAGAVLPSGSICMIDETGVAKAHDLSNTLPHFVFRGTENPGVQSEVGNIAGGILTTFPLTGNYRVNTQVFEQVEGVNYNRNDYVTIASVDTTVEGKTSKVTMFTKQNAAPYSSIIAGIVVRPVFINKIGQKTLTVDFYFLPKQG